MSVTVDKIWTLTFVYWTVWAFFLTNPQKLQTLTLFAVLLKWPVLCVFAFVLFFRDGGHTGAHELGHVAAGAAWLLRSLPDQADEVQERQLPQLPGLQARETRLGLLRAPGVSASFYTLFTSAQLSLVDLVSIVTDQTKGLDNNETIESRSKTGTWRWLRWHNERYHNPDSRWLRTSDAFWGRSPNTSWTYKRSPFHPQNTDLKA